MRLKFFWHIIHFGHIFVIKIKAAFFHFLSILYWILQILLMIRYLTEIKVWIKYLKGSESDNKFKYCNIVFKRIKNHLANIYFKIAKCLLVLLKSIFKYLTLLELPDPLPYLTQTLISVKYQIINKIWRIQYNLSRKWENTALILLKKICPMRIMGQEYFNCKHFYSKTDYF